MRKFALDQTALLLERFAAQLKHTSAVDDADSIHDLRVSIRRLSRCLRTFSQFYPRSSWKPIRRRLSDLIHAAGEIRDRDIALELLAEAGISARAKIMQQLSTERRGAAANLQAELNRWNKRDYPHTWRSRLEL